MNYSLYKKEKSELETDQIKGYFDTFDSKKHLMSDYKLVFILPNGKCLFMPYVGEFGHIVYLFPAFEMLYNELKDTKGNYMNEELFEIFIAKKFEYVHIPNFIKAILKSNIAIFYNLKKENTGYKTYFQKNKLLTLQQKNTLLEIKASLKKEGYGIEIGTLIDDESLNFNLSFGYTFEKDTPCKWVIKKQGDKEICRFLVDEAYKILGLPERKQGDEEFLK